MATVINIEGPIGGFFNNAQELRGKLKAAEGDVIVNINSKGGDAFEGILMHNELKAFEGNVTARFGVAASAATIIGMGADQIEGIENGFFLPHKALVGLDIMGNFNEDDLDEIINDLKNQRNNVEKVTRALVAIYAQKTGRQKRTILRQMEKDEWLTMAEAKDKGFVDKIVSASDSANKAMRAIRAEVTDDLPTILKPKNKTMSNENLKGYIEKALEPVKNFIEGKSEEEKFEAKLQKSVDGLNKDFEEKVKEVKNQMEETQKEKIGEINKSLKAIFETDDLEKIKKAQEEQKQKIAKYEGTGTDTKPKGDTDPTVSTTASDGDEAFWNFIADQAGVRLPAKNK